MSIGTFITACAVIAVIGVLLWGSVCYLVQNEDKVAKFFSEDPEVNDFEELRKNGR